MRVFCDRRYPDVIGEIAVAMGRVIPSKVGHVVWSGHVEIHSSSKHWPCLFPQHGPGRKHLRPIRLEPWQQEIVDRYPKQLLRGLIHSDGWRGNNKIGERLYPRYQFTNASEDIRKIFCDACDRLGISWRQMNARNISIARRADVARMDEFVGPKS